MEKSVFERYAIFQTGGKQYQALEGKTIAIEKIDAEVGAEVIFDEVLLRKVREGEVSVGQPFLDEPIRAEVIKHGRDEKILVAKFKRRKQYRVRQGHRQALTVIRITAI